MNGEKLKDIFRIYRWPLLLYHKGMFGILLEELVIGSKIPDAPQIFIMYMQIPCQYFVVFSGEIDLVI